MMRIFRWGIYRTLNEDKGYTLYFALSNLTVLFFACSSELLS